VTSPLADTLRILAVTDPVVLGDRDWADVGRAVVLGGATSIQVRHPGVPARDLAALTRALMAAVPVPIFVNDRLDVALAVGAAGVHLGSDDVPVALARGIAPPEFIIGASVGLADEVSQGAMADYWGVGPFRATVTKDAGSPLGIEGFAEFIRLAGAIPCVAIGGVRPEDVPDLVSAGASGVAAVSGIFADEDVTAAAAGYARAFHDLER